MVEPVSVVGVEGGTTATEPELLKGGLEYVACPYPTTTNNGERTGNILITILVKLIVIILENFISIPNFYFVYSIREQKKHPMFTTFVSGLGPNLPNNIVMFIDFSTEFCEYDCDCGGPRHLR